MGRIIFPGEGDDQILGWVGESLSRGKLCYLLNKNKEEKVFLQS